MSRTRHAYPSDVSDEEWAFVASYLVLSPEDAFACLMLHRFTLLTFGPQSALGMGSIGISARRAERSR
jgi:hypothetical protein